jgi:hypothetical protein
MVDMTMRGSCTCRNIQVVWRTVDYSVVPRKCLCPYCAAKNAAYVSKSGSLVQVSIHNAHLHNIARHGSGTAEFHECGNCHDLVLVTVAIQGDVYGALNANCLHNRHGFAPAVDIDFSNQGTAEKLQRWRQNWCHPVEMLVNPAGR